MKTVAIIGGGASGMMAALKAAEDKDNKVILFERQERVGRKLLSTGNGRCNLTNTGLTIANYHGVADGLGKSATFAGSALSQLSPQDTVNFFESLGLVCTEQYGGRVYPFSDMAGSVLDVLRFALEDRGVDVRTGTEITLAGKNDNGKFYIYSGKSSIEADCLIVACGGKAAAKNGGTTLGYDILRSFGHKCTELYPALVPIRTDTDYPRALRGIRTQALVLLYHGDELTGESLGELQFTDRGISGPAAFDISRQASIGGGTVVIDFVPEMSADQLGGLLLRRQHISSKQEAAAVFTGILQSRVGMCIVKEAGIRPSEKLSRLSDEEILKIAKAAKRFPMNITGTDPFDTAQVTAGGIETADFNPETLESKLVPGLFACGEVLDIDGDCGGFNLQWAWSSGFVAGKLGK